VLCVTSTKGCTSFEKLLNLLLKRYPTSSILLNPFAEGGTCCPFCHEFLPICLTSFHPGEGEFVKRYILLMKLLNALSRLDNALPCIG
jgi:hypothetical protein